MSLSPINRSPDLKRLKEEGFEIEVRNGHLLIHAVPYLNSKKEVCFGTLVSVLDLAGDKTLKPQTHVIYFSGEHPCDKEGNIIKGIQHASQKQTFAEGIYVDHSFSNKPAGGYADYYEKVTNYIRILEAQAKSIDPSVSAKTFKDIESKENNSVFNYSDTNSAKAGIENISAKLKTLKIAIVGLGGTGSYVLDYVSKTPVKEIHLFDGDNFLSHNAFRAPGAPTIDELREIKKKVVYFCELYSKMRKNIFSHDVFISESTLNELTGMDFVFICIDRGDLKKIIIQKLITDKIPFIDVGVGINEIGGLLQGHVRVTTGTKDKNDHASEVISFANDGNDDYSKNIQISEINALNASLAVIKWKKLFGFYHDMGKEHHSVYDINTNLMENKYETNS